MRALCKGAELHATLGSPRHSLFYTELAPPDPSFCLTTGLK